MNDYTVEVKYMVNGCGKKIPSTRTVVVKCGDRVVFEERTQENIEEVMNRVKKIDFPPISD